MHMHAFLAAGTSTYLFMSQPRASAGQSRLVASLAQVSPQFADAVAGAAPDLAGLRPRAKVGPAAPGAGEAGSQLPLKWCIFVTPEGFVDQAAARQRRAIVSWLRLVPRPRVVLVGAGVGYDAIASEYGLEINSGLDMNLVQMPLAGSLIDVAMQSVPDAEVSVIVNSDVMLTQSFVHGLVKVNNQFDAWFLTGARTDLNSLPSKFEPTNPKFSDAEFCEYAANIGVLHTAGGNDYFAWNNKKLPSGQPVPLTSGKIPPFIRGKSKFDNWIVHEAIEGRHRDVVDGSDGVMVVHINHNYQTADKKQTVKGSSVKAGSTFWQSAKDSECS